MIKFGAGFKCTNHTPCNRSTQLAQDTHHSIAEVLSRQPLFRGMSPEELQPIAAGCREFRVRKNVVLFQKGDMAEGLHVLVMGQVKLAIPSAQGAEKVVHMCGPGSTFGEAVLFQEHPYPVMAQTTVDSIVLLITKRTLLEAMDSSPILVRRMLASLSLHLHELLENMESCTLRTSAQRVACFLTQAIPVLNDGPYEIHLPASKQTLASQLNLAPETLSRVLGHLAEAGLIKVKGRTITVLDCRKLRSFTA
ncbi:MAG: Crp/Fnr family transcriptional regulator [Hydrogenophilales bacterium CG_4_9_14_3_um_filter_63_34]|nr:MAG: Crp/Fnr family transcriptional regulator [Hydrogenophilales bacterium CG_4_10_14_3_um_filter_63_21]PJB03296.1 MAG: Crp/Fnr family transcriptional regulator [Hydrogenophilales bacterium CG_4_9_14_3_um_filter_63_34]